MREIRLLIICFFIFSFARAQDSSWLDLGRTQLRKEFTQNVTIRGEDLRRLPFTSLSQAIDVWLSGTYTNSFNLIYVIDGIRCADVNMYSIEEIEEVTLVQNAEVQLNGAFKQQQLVLIKTKRLKTNGSVLVITGQSQLVDRRYNRDGIPGRADSEKNFYHQYGASAFTRTDRLSAGGTLNWTHEANPAAKTPSTHFTAPEHFDRYRINGYLDYRLSLRHVLNAKLNVVGQPSSFSAVDVAGPSRQLRDNEAKDRAINPELALYSQFEKGFQNSFGVSYMGLNRERIDDAELTGVITYRQHSEMEYRYNTVFLHNTIRWEKEQGNWRFSPALNFAFRYLENKQANATVLNGGSIPGGAFSGYSLYHHSRSFTLTPSMDLSYGKAFNLDAGMVTELNRFRHRDFFPYGSVTADLLKLANGSGDGKSLKVFGSYASGGYFFDENILLQDYSDHGSLFPANSYLIPFPNNSDSNFYIWQAGTVFSTEGQRFSFSYNFEKRDYTLQMLMPIIVGGGVGTALVFTEGVASSHRIGLSFRAVETDNLSWMTSLNATSIKSKSKDLPEFSSSNDISGEYNDQKRSWTGGWVNRLNLRRFSMGIDLLYHARKPYYDFFGNPSTISMVGLRYAFLSWRLPLRGTRSTEIYLSTRGLFQTEDYQLLLDARRSYGLGARIEL